MCTKYKYTSNNFKYKTHLKKNTTIIPQQQITNNIMDIHLNNHEDKMYKIPNTPINNNNH